ncbi:MAG TPA: cytochrome c oxidase subunit II [Ktedonobacterales bacterium]|nr:cytochrome c oxidase subunit II [Ktedonobacterales bacterium]
MRFTSKMRRLAGGAVLALIASAVLSACADNHANFLLPQSNAANAESNLFWFILIVATVIFVGVTSVLLYSVVRFRARPNGPEARQTHGNTKIEIAWTITPSIILFIILAVTINTMFAIASPPNNQTDMTVNAIGHQWWWEFQYPDSKVVTADEMRIPVGARVHVNLISDNVIHSFWVPELVGKTDVIPGHNNSLWIQARTAGTYRGECTEFCGAQHAHMDFEIVVQSQADYNTWLASQQNPGATPAAGSQEASGYKVFTTSGCLSCHAVNCPDTVSQCPTNVGTIHIGPNLTHFGSRDLIAGGVLSNDPTNLTQWILHAQDVKYGADMPSFDGTSPGYSALSQQQVDDLVVYLESLK